MKRKSPTPKTNTTKSPSQRKSTSSRKGTKTQSVRNPRVSKGSLAKAALPDGRAFDSRSEFTPTLVDLDLHLVGEGKHLRIYDKLGAHAVTPEGKRGVGV